jgi:hypothetical protein
LFLLKPASDLLDKLGGRRPVVAAHTRRNLSHTPCPSFSNQTHTLHEVTVNSGLLTSLLESFSIFYSYFSVSFASKRLIRAPSICETVRGFDTQLNHRPPAIATTLTVSMLDTASAFA